MRTLHLYRNILKNIKFYPSIKRDRLIAEVRYGESIAICAVMPVVTRMMLAEFRKHRDERDPVKLAKQIAVATKSLEQLQMYTKLRSNSGDW